MILVVYLKLLMRCKGQPRRPSPDIAPLTRQLVDLAVGHTDMVYSLVEGQLRGHKHHLWEFAFDNPVSLLRAIDRIASDLEVEFMMEGDKVCIGFSGLLGERYRQARDALLAETVPAPVN
jgi:hypothetical protein